MHGQGGELRQEPRGDVSAYPLGPGDRLPPDQSEGQGAADEQLTGTPKQHRLLEQGYEPPQTAAQANVFTAISWGGLALVSVVGIAWLLLVRRHAGREARALWRIPMHT